MIHLLNLRGQMLISLGELNVTRRVVQQLIKDTKSIVFPVSAKAVSKIFVSSPKHHITLSNRTCHATTN